MRSYDWQGGLSLNPCALRVRSQPTETADLGFFFLRQSRSYLAAHIIGHHVNTRPSHVAFDVLL